MLRIERLTLRLPPGYEGRAGSIARMIGENLAGIDSAKGGTLRNLVIAPVRIAADSSDAEIARTVASGISAQLESKLEVKL